MKKIVLSLVVLLISIYGLSQEGKYIQFKLYKNLEFDLGQTQATRTITLGTFSPAIAWGKNENFNEIQIQAINFFSRSEAKAYSGELEYTYNYCVSDDTKSRIQFFFGGGIGGGFESIYSEIFRNSTVAVATTGKYIRFHLIGIPRVTYRLNNTISLDASLPYKFIDYEHSRLSEYDTRVPENQQTTTFNTIDYFRSAVSFKFGAIVKF